MTVGYRPALLRQDAAEFHAGVGDQEMTVRITAPGARPGLAGPLYALGVVVWALSALTVPVSADDWPQWRGPDRNGISAETNWLVNWPPVTAWTQDVQLGYSSVAIVSNRLYTMGWNSNTTQDVVYCLDALDGTQIWTFAYDCTHPDAYTRDFPGPRATPTVEGDHVYTYSQIGQLFCLDAGSGSVIWSNVVNAGRPAYGHSSSPLVEGDLLLLNAGSNGTAVAKTTGTVVWGGVGKKWLAGYSSPFVIDWGGQRVAVLFTRSGLDGVNAQTGDRLWWYKTSGHFNTSDPVVYGDKVLTTNLEDGYCDVLQLAGGALTRVPIDPGIYCWFCSPLLQGDYVYGFDAISTLTCVDLRDGSTQWARDDLGLSEGGLIGADGKLIVIGEKGDLAIAEATPTQYDDGGRPIVKVVPGAEAEEWHTAPVLANGRIYCRSRHGSLVCLRTGPPAADIDLNGMADNWERQHFGRTNGVPHGAGDDPDRDGLDNRTEYIVGTVPTNVDSRYGLVIGVSNASVVVRYATQPADGVGYEGMSRFYRLEQSAKVSVDGWQTVGGHGDVPGDGAVHAHTNDAPARVGVYRIGVRLQDAVGD